jgi:hypothetical protein
MCPFVIYTPNASSGQALPVFFAENSQTNFLLVSVRSPAASIWLSRLFAIHRKKLRYNEYHSQILSVRNVRLLVAKCYLAHTEHEMNCDRLRFETCVAGLLAKRSVDWSQGPLRQQVGKERVPCRMPPGVTAPSFLGIPSGQI